MEIRSKFNGDDFEVWADHFQYLDLGERHQSVPSGKSYIRGTFDSEQNAYIIDKIHIDPDMLQTSVKEELMREVGLQVHKRDKKLLRKNRVAAMPKHELRMRLERNQPSDDRPMITDDLQNKVYEIATFLVKALKDPQGSTPGDNKWRVSGLSRSSWSINHPDIMNEGESPLRLTIRKLPDGMWGAFGLNRLTNLSTIETLAKKETPPGGDDWDMETFAKDAARFFQEQKANILALKQAMTPQIAPGAMSGGQPQQGGGGEMGGMGMGGMGMGGMGGGMAASRRARRRKAVGSELTPAQAQEAGQGPTVGGPETTPQVNQKVQGFVYDAMQRAVRLQRGISARGAQVSSRATLGSINDMNNLVHGAAVTLQGNLGTNTPQTRSLFQKLTTASGFLQAAARVIMQAGPRVEQEALTEALRNLNGFIRTGNEVLRPPTTKQSSRRVSATLGNLRKAQRIARQIYRYCENQDWFLGVRVINDRNGIGVGVGVSEIPSRSLRSSLEGIPVALEGPGARMIRAQQERKKHLRLAHRLAMEVAEEMEQKDSAVTGIRGPMFDQLSGAESDLLKELDQHPQGISMDQVEDQTLLNLLIQKGYVERGPRNTVRTLGIAASRRSHRRVGEMAGMAIDPETERHQKMVRRVFRHIKNHNRLYGSVKYLSRKLGITFEDLVKVIGQLIVEGKIEMTKRKKFKVLPEPHTPVPGMAGKFAATNSVFGIDRGRSDKRVDQLLSQSNYQLNLNEDVDGTKYMRDIRERPSKIMPDPTQPN